MVKTDKAYAGTILNTALNLIRLFAQLSAPIMPTTCARMLDLIGEPAEYRWPTAKMAAYLTGVPAGRAFKQSEPLFQKIMPETAEALKIKYKESEN